MHRPYLSPLLACALALAGVLHAAAQQSCRPTLAFREVEFSPMQPPTLERKWTALVSVDASRCIANSEGSFDVVFVRLKEIGVDAVFRQRFKWLPPSVQVGIGFSADEAIGHYWIDNVTPCSCAP